MIRLVTSLPSIDVGNRCPGLRGSSSVKKSDIFSVQADLKITNGFQKAEKWPTKTIGID